MFGRKNKSRPEQGRARRPRGTERPSNPAFSYYASRSTEVAPRRSSARQPREDSAGKGRHVPRLPLAKVPFWLFVAVIVICVIKLLFLSSDPKVIVLGQSAATGTYAQPADTYAQAAHKLLAGSIANHTKLTADVGGTARALEREFPELQTASVTLPLIGNRPIVYVQLTPPSVVLQNHSGNFALNGDGIVLARLKSLPAHIPTLVDQSTGIPQVGKQYLPGSTVSFIQTLAYQMGAAKLSVSTYVLPLASPYELDARLEGKPYIIRYNLEADARVQSGAAIAAIQQLSTAAPSSYLDVRTPGQVYYK